MMWHVQAWRHQILRQRPTRRWPRKTRPKQATPYPRSASLTLMRCCIRPGVAQWPRLARPPRKSSPLQARTSQDPTCHAMRMNDTRFQGAPAAQQYAAHQSLSVQGSCTCWGYVYIARQCGPLPCICPARFLPPSLAVMPQAKRMKLSQHIDA